MSPNPRDLLPLAKALCDTYRAMATFAELNVHTFAGWSGPFKGPRGGTYWLREGAQDVEANRVYGDQPGDGADPARQDIRPAIDTASRVLAGATVGGLTGSALAGPLGAAIGGAAGAALGTDTARTVLGGIRELLNGGEEPEGTADRLADVSRKAQAGDAAATQTIRADTTAQVRELAARLVAEPPADPAEVRQGWRQASADMRPADAAELGGHVGALAAARDEGGIRAAVGGIAGFLGRLAGGALRAAFGAIKAFARWAFDTSKPYLTWAAALATGTAVLFSPAVALGAGLISWQAAFLLAPPATAGWFGAMMIGRHVQKTTGKYGVPRAERFAEGGRATLEQVRDDPAGALELIKKLAGRVRQVVGFSEDGAGWTAEGVRRNPAGALACIERLRKRVASETRTLP